MTVFHWEILVAAVIIGLMNRGKLVRIGMNVKNQPYLFPLSIFLLFLTLFISSLFYLPNTLFLLPLSLFGSCYTLYHLGVAKTNFFENRSECIRVCSVLLAVAAACMGAAAAAKMPYFEVLSLTLLMLNVCGVFVSLGWQHFEDLVQKRLPSTIERSGLHIGALVVVSILQILVNLEVHFCYLEFSNAKSLIKPAQWLLFLSTLYITDRLKTKFSSSKCWKLSIILFALTVFFFRKMVVSDIVCLGVFNSAAISYLMAMYFYFMSIALEIMEEERADEAEFRMLGLQLAADEIAGG